MAVEFNKLSGDWAKCKPKLAPIWASMDSAANTEKNTQDLLEGAREDIVERVFEAKKAGVDGTKLADFLDVKEIKTAWDSIEKILKTLETAHDKYQAGIGSLKQFHVEASAIRDKANAEVKARKKKILESKSIPDLEKLAAEIDTTLTTASKAHGSSIQKFATQKPDTFTFDKTTETRINKDIKAGINSVKVDADIATVLREFAIRHVGVVIAGLQKSAKEVTAHCKDALIAAKAQDKDAVKRALDAATKIADNAQKISEKYAKGIKNHGGEIGAHKDGKAMLKQVQGINVAVKAILNQIATVQKAVG